MNKIKQIHNILTQVNALDIKIFDYENRSPFFDYIVLATTNERQASAAVGYFKKDNLSSLNQVEGTDKSGWILVDTGDVIVHLFTKEDRKFYNFDERLFGVKEIVVKE